jgi:molecular chaperone GrpE
VKVTDRRRFHSEGGAAGRQQGEALDGTVTEDRAGEIETPRAAEAVGAAEAPDSEELRRQAEEYRDHLQRLKAEFDNYRKRVLREQTHAVEMASEPLIRRLLEVLDEFDLALMAAEQKPDFDKFLHGVELVYGKLLDSLKSEGLERIEAKGKLFDPAVHEALMQTGEPEGEPVVGDVFRQGYTLRGRVIRPAGVKVVRR